MRPTPSPRAPRAQISRVPYLPGLDGLRALAVVAVMIYHANHEWLGGGFLGVEVFFVISGYLITLLLIGEHERTSRIDLRQFWLRRFRRLLPALYVMLAALAVYMAFWARDSQGRTRGDFLGGIFYISNWYQIFVGQGYTASGAFAPLRHLWSLAVEEQFYLLWPLIMVLILRRGRAHLPRVAMWLAGVSVAIAVLVAALYAGGDVNATCSPESMNGYWKLFGRCISINDTLYLSTITRAGGLMLGAAFAMVWRPLAIMRGPLRNKGRQLDLLALVGVAALALLMWKLSLSGSGTSFGSRFDPWLFRGGFFLTSVATLLVIAAVTHQRSLTGKALGNPVLNWVGTRSYGLYLFHWPIYQIIRKFAGVGLTGAQFVLAMCITVPITELSYRFIETPIRKGRLSDWLQRRSPPGTQREPLHPLENDRRPIYALGVVVLALVGFAGFSIGTADNHCVGDVECTLVQAGGETTTTAPTATTVDPATTVAGQPSVETTTTLPPATTTTVPAPPPAMVAIGESVMKGATGTLTTGGFVVYAEEDRQASQMAEVVAQLRADNKLGPLVVLQIGTNGTATDADWAAIMQSLPAATTPNVYVLTVKAPKPWIDGNNQRIYALPSRYPNVHVIDWAGRAAEISGDLSSSDGGVHLKTKKAMQFYANMIFDNIGRVDLDQPLPT